MSRREKQERWVPVPLTYLLSVQEFSHGLNAETHSSPLGRYMGTDVRIGSRARRGKRFYTLRLWGAENTSRGNSITVQSGRKIVTSEGNRVLWNKNTQTKGQNNSGTMKAENVA